MSRSQAIGIIGAGDQARETAAYILDAGLDIAWFAVEEGFLAAARTDPRLRAPVVALEDALAADAEVPVLVALGYPGDRRRLAEAWSGPTFAIHLSDAAWLAPGIPVGPGTVVCPGAVISAGARLGEHVLVNLGATLSHDCDVGDFATVSPGAHVAGHVTIGAGSFVGVGATVSDRCRIGSGCLIGAGSVVIRDVPDATVVVGVPARELRTLDRWP
jgi:acetyltransferase EpsM